MKVLIIFFLFLSSALSALPFHLKDRLQKGKAGDFIVFEARGLITLVCLRSLTPHTVIFEEISAPSRSLKQLPASWDEWVKKRALGHTSWSMVEIDLISGEVIECYSFSKGAWLRLAPEESLLATLLSTPLKAVPFDQRKRIGPPPLAGESDFRKVWNPPLVYEGKVLSNCEFDAFEAIWPQDGSEIAGKKVTLYFDNQKKFPLPYWLQVDTAHATAILRTIDSGKNLSSLYPGLPRRAPEFIGYHQKSGKGLKLSLKSPKYYNEFDLFAIDLSSERKEIVPLAYSLIREKGEFISLEIKEEDLKEQLKPDHHYNWLIVPSGYTEYYIESSKSFVWKVDRNLTDS